MREGQIRHCVQDDMVGWRKAPRFLRRAGFPQGRAGVRASPMENRRKRGVPQMKGLVMNFSKVHNKASLLLFLVVSATEIPRSGAGSFGCALRAPLRMTWFLPFRRGGEAAEQLFKSERSERQRI